LPYLQLLYIVVVMPEYVCHFLVFRLQNLVQRKGVFKPLSQTLDRVVKTGHLLLISLTHLCQLLLGSLRLLLVLSNPTCSRASAELRLFHLVVVLLLKRSNLVTHEL